MTPSPAAPLPKQKIGGSSSINSGKRNSRTGIGRAGGYGYAGQGMNGFLDTLNPAAASKSKAAGAGPALKADPLALVRLDPASAAPTPISLPCLGSAKMAQKN